MVNVLIAREKLNLVIKGSSLDRSLNPNCHLLAVFLWTNSNFYLASISLSLQKGYSNSNYLMKSCED